VFIEKWLVEAFENFIQDFLKVCGNVPEAGYLPIVVTKICFKI
jgi:hypothetical protein